MGMAKDLRAVRPRAHVAVEQDSDLDLAPFPFRAVLFDFDGTLADGYGAITESVNAVRTEIGLPPIPAAEVRQHVGRGLRELLLRAVPECDAEAAIQIYRTHYWNMMIAGTQLLPGATDVLMELRRRDA